MNHTLRPPRQKENERERKKKDYTKLFFANLLGIKARRRHGEHAQGEREKLGIKINIYCEDYCW
jgi:hypothetical protein